ncbi:uncharacterized protein SPSK_05687 [Sporothrix schenckii 1099-18]|uniref:Uncharacterized protein n=1 Tax=Sporothrix schenckii 1099-18 TaxID=1397361 RepID=A0A0F2LRX8_SPOSC|nr:uncharacterized protein SPSK_05687 [Sporothrix schenckii 1099-18]KJR80283.1 hypothetical protein SPSK_05687 [Sporothrix schenckii 1099-18]
MQPASFGQQNASPTLVKSLETSAREAREGKNRPGADGRTVQYGCAWASRRPRTRIRPIVPVMTFPASEPRPSDNVTMQPRTRSSLSPAGGLLSGSRQFSMGVPMPTNSPRLRAAQVLVANFIDF